MTKAFFDHISTTPLDPGVFEAMRPYFLDRYGNPSSHIHDQGQEAVRAVDRARAEVAALIGAKAGEIVFTSGATESNNLAVLGAAEGAGAGKRHVVVSDVEHFSVMNALIPLRNAGYEVTILPVDRNGVVDPDAVRKALRADTALLSVMHANSEIGTIEPVGPIGRIAREAGVTFHVDATASAGHIPVDVREIPADLVTLSAHNFYGPKGAGALYLREGTKVAPRTFGGFQEMGYRAGTENVPAVVGMGAAANLAAREMGAWAEHLSRLGKTLWDGLAAIPMLHYTGHPSRTSSRARLLLGRACRGGVAPPVPQHEGDHGRVRIRVQLQPAGTRRGGSGGLPRAPGDRRAERHLHRVDHLQPREGEHRGRGPSGPRCASRHRGTAQGDVPDVSRLPEAASQRRMTGSWRRDPIAKR